MRNETKNRQDLIFNTISANSTLGTTKEGSCLDFGWGHIQNGTVIPNDTLGQFNLVKIIIIESKEILFFYQLLSNVYDETYIFQGWLDFRPKDPLPGSKLQEIPLA